VLQLSDLAVGNGSCAGRGRAGSAWATHGHSQGEGLHVPCVHLVGSLLAPAFIRRGIKHWLGVMLAVVRAWECELVVLQPHSNPIILDSLRIQASAEIVPRNRRVGLHLWRALNRFNFANKFHTVAQEIIETNFYHEGLQRRPFLPFPVRTFKIVNDEEYRVV